MRAHVIFTLVFLGMLRTVSAEQFSFDDAADLERWMVEFGNWEVSDGALLQKEAGAGRTMLWLPDAAFSDVDVSAEFYIHPVGSGVKAPGIAYRARDQYTYYYIHFDLRNSQVVWVRSTPEREWTEARRHPFAGLKAEHWQTARVVCEGETHKVFLDGELLFTETDGTIPSGVVGLRTGQGRVAFRNVTIEGKEAQLDDSFKVQKAPYSIVCSDAGAGAYEAFPDVCRTASGDLICVFYAGYGHVSVPNEALPNGARISMVRSSDEGQTWSEAEVVVDSPIDDRDASITQLSNGDLLVVYMSYDPKRKPGTHQIFTVRSKDGGHTWSAPRRVPTAFTANEAVSEPAREMPDGRLLLPAYGSMKDQPRPRYVSGVLESTDRGRTWTSLALIRSLEHELCEPSLVRFPDGRLLMVIRPGMTWCESLDGGKTWSDVKPMPVPGDAPYLLLTSDGVLLCAFRHRPTRSTCLIHSTDQGRTWSPMLTLDRVLGAYPSMVELDDGRVLVVYYTEGGGSDIRSVFLDVDGAGVTLIPNEP